MLRIGLLIDSLIGGGAERVVLNLFSIFSRLGHDPHIILIKNKIDIPIEEVPSSKIHILSKDGVLSHNKFLNKLMLSQKLKQVIKKIESDGLSFHFYISNAEDMDRITKIAKLPNVYIRYRNCMSEYIKNKIGNKGYIKTLIRKYRFLRKFRKIYNNRHIITVSQALADDILKNVGIKPKSIKTIYNPFNFEKIRKLGNEKEDLPSEPYIIYAAKFENRKRHDLLIDAYYKANIPHKLVLIGGCYTESDRLTFKKLLNQIHRLKLQHKVILPGFQKNPYPWIKNASLFVMSSDSEGLPTVLIESLILGTPVVSTDCPTGPREILTGQLSKFLSPPGDSEALAKNIKSALDSYPEINEDILKKFDENYVAKQYIEHCLKK
ncbi:glycosyltransferase [Thermodesulfovibrio sp.]|uniref:glycosyltransferase n=1 Tax=Thermodesulfovibrio sp. TaxID=2067987 RepID=UPI003D11A9A8